MALNKFLVALWLVGVAISVQGQGTFRNLDFESAKVPALPYGESGSLDGVSSLDALPGWICYIGSSPTSRVLHNNYTLGSASLSILGPVWANYGGSSIVEGNYTAALQAGDLDEPPFSASASIAQVGTVPPDAESIRVKIYPFVDARYTFGLFLGAQAIPMVVLSQNGRTLLLGGDVSSYAGKLEELRLSSIQTPQSPFGSILVDDIVFSNQPIPEPTALALLLFGGVLVGLWRKSKQFGFWTHRRLPRAGRASRAGSR